MAVVSWLWVWVGYAGILCVGGFALWRGGWAERLAATSILIAWFLTPVVQRHYDPGLAGFAIDAVTTLILLGIAFKVRRIWALFASASMLGALACHLLAALFSGLGYFSYITALGILSGYYLIFGLAAGVIEHRFIVKNRDTLGLAANG